jgi:hypothetical protein
VSNFISGSNQLKWKWNISNVDHYIYRLDWIFKRERKNYKPKRLQNQFFQMFEQFHLNF